MKRLSYSLIKTACIVLLLLPLSGCSTFGFFYERLDWLIVWRANSMFDLTEEQEATLKPKAIEFREWLREDGFPHIISELETSRDQWKQGEHYAAYSYLEQAIVSFTPEFLENSAPMVLAITQDFTEQNARKFQHYTESKYEDWFEYAESDENKADARIEKLDEWFGDLSDSQVALVRKWSKLEVNERQIRIDNSNQWRKRLIDAALAGETATISEWIHQPEIWWTEEYAYVHEQNRNAVSALLKELMPTLTDRQKKNAVKRINEWISNLKDTAN